MRRNRTLALLLLLSALALLPLTAAAQQPAEVALQPPAAVPGAGETFTTDVTIANASDLLGFQFDVNFDPANLAVETIALGPFLASTGRSPQPLGPDSTGAATGRVVFGGFTLGTAEQPGASGDGVLATITWKVVQPADFQASLSRVQLAGANGRALPGSDTPSPATQPSPQATEAQAPTQPPAQPSPTAVPAAAETQGSSSLAVVALAALAAVVIVAVVLLLVRRSKPKSS